MVKLPWTIAMFIGGTKYFPRAENLRAGRPSTSTTNENIDEVKKIVESPLEKLLTT